MDDRKRSNEKPPKNEVFRGFYILSILRLTLRDRSGIRNQESEIRNPKSNERSEEERRDERNAE